MGLPYVDLANFNIEDQQSQHIDPKVLAEPTSVPVTPVAYSCDPKLEPLTPVALNNELTPEPEFKVRSFLIYKCLIELRRVLLL